MLKNACSSRTRIRPVVALLALAGLLGVSVGCTAEPVTTAAVVPSTAASTTARPPVEASTSTAPPRASAPPTQSTTPTTASKPRPTGAVTPAPQARPGTALYVLATLPVKGRAPKTGYDRDRFGSGWTDTNHNSCTTRGDILRRDLRPVTVLAGTGGCAVTAGTLADPYTGRTIAFRKGETTSDDVQIDHIVALSDAWQKGAQQWSTSKRVRFANDFLELLATDGPTNSAKSDSDAASWLPPHKSYRCTYIARQISIKAHYGLWVTQAEQAAMGRVLSTCPDQPVVSREAVTTARSPNVTVDRPAPRPAPLPPVDEGSDGGAASYANCAAVRAAGAAPIHKRDPGYERTLDRDGDGVGCE